eukprot:g1317.t1
MLLESNFLLSFDLKHYNKGEMNRLRKTLLFIPLFFQCFLYAKGQQCGFIAPDGTEYDLRGMTRILGSDGDFTKQVQVGSSIEFLYRVNICANTLALCQGTPGSVTESLKIPAGETCRVLGRLNGMTFKPLTLPPTPDNPNGDGLQLVYRNGDICDPIQRSTRSVIINLQCSISTIGPGTLDEMKKDDTCTTSFTMKSRDACGVSAIGFGFFFLYMFCLCGFIYCVGGAIYNWRVVGAQGKEMIPHLEVWQEFPSLVKDGVRYTLESGNRGFVDLKSKYTSVQ